MIYLTLFLEFFKIGLFCFGGGFGMIPLVEETVLNYGWLTESEFFNFVGVCESTPGPIAVNMATYVGSAQAGFLGGVCATFGVVTPSFIIILLIASVLKRFADNKYSKSFISGVNPVITALILSTGFILLAKSFGYVSLTEWNTNMVSVIIFGIISAVYFVAQKYCGKKLSAVQIILISAGLGVVVSVAAEKII